MTSLLKHLRSLMTDRRIRKCGGKVNHVPPQFCPTCSRHIASRCKELNCPVVEVEKARSSCLYQWPGPGGIPFPH